MKIIKKASKRVGLGIFIVIFLFAFVLYGPFSAVRELLITSSIRTINHKYIAYFFYSPKTINDVMYRNRVEQITEDTDAALVNKIVQRSDELYKIIEIRRTGFRAYLCIVFDPAMIDIGVTRYLGEKGEFICEESYKTGAVLAINAGGFNDYYNGDKMGGMPDGIIIKDGIIVWDSKEKDVIRNMIGFNYNNILVLSAATPQQAIENNYKIAVEFEPFLIVNGKRAEIIGNGGWGIAPRTAIGQTADGTILFLVVDGRSVESAGATMWDLQDIMYEYGAVNAANLDGGSTSILVENGKVINQPSGYSMYGEIMYPNWFIVRDNN